MDQRFEVMLEPLRVFLAQVGDFLPRLALALIVLIAGWLIAKAVRFAISRGLRNVNFHVITDRAGIRARYAILAFVVLIALDQVNIGGDIVRQTFLILLAGVVFALALAFGLGGREWAAEFLERWWPRKKRP